VARLCARPNQGNSKNTKTKMWWLQVVVLFSLNSQFPLRKNINLNQINTNMADEEKKTPTAAEKAYPLFSEADFANYFCAYAQLYHQKHMLADHNRMAAYHSAILGNQEVFRDKVVMDVGTGSGIRKYFLVFFAYLRTYRTQSHSHLHPF
jgi:hypothetical protein